MLLHFVFKKMKIDIRIYILQLKSKGKNNKKCLVGMLFAKTKNCYLKLIFFRADSIKMNEIRTMKICKI